MKTYPGGIETAPHSAGADYGYLWRIKELHGAGGWAGGYTSHDDAYLGAIRWLIAQAAALEAAEDELATRAGKLAALEGVLVSGCN